jgi:CheY-like chemotaxis protein
VVDDEPLVAKSVARLLRGDAVVVASNGAEALRALRSLEVDMVISDVMMPVLDGPAFFRALEAEGSPLCGRFFFMTGAAKGELDEALARTGRPVLFKPIARQALLETLAGGGGAGGSASE